MNAREAVEDALGEWDAFRQGVPGARTASGDQLAEATRALLAECVTVAGRAWAEGHAATDEHGPGLCECVNPYPTVQESDV